MPGLKGWVGAWAVVWAEAGDVSVWWVAAAGAAATVLTAVTTAVVTLLSTYSAAAKQKRADALAEWQEIAERQQADLDRLVTESRAMREAYERETREAREREQDCKVRLARMEGDVKLLEATVRRLQRLAGDEPPAVTMPGVAVADTKGTLKVVSPALAAMLHYLPHELAGKNVEVIIPERYREAHRRALAAASGAAGAPWPERVVVAEALTREGDEVPVTIALSGWQTALGEWLISAEVRPRSAAADPKGGVP